MRGVRLCALLALATATATYALPGTPFYAPRDGAWMFHGADAAGRVDGSGLHLHVRGATETTWGTVSSWTRIAPDSAPVSTVRNLRYGRDAKPAFSSLEAWTDDDVSVRIIRDGERLKSEVRLLRGDTARLFWDGVESIEISERGDELTARVGDVVIREVGLHCWQPLRGGPLSVPCRFTSPARVAERRFEYQVRTSPVDPSQPVVIDPVFVWSAQLGGTARETGSALVADRSQSPAILYLGGSTFSPTTDFPDASIVGGSDLDVDGLIATTPEDAAPPSWSYTIVGGDGVDRITELTMDADAGLCVVGSTQSPFATLNVAAAQPEFFGTPPGDAGTPTFDVFLVCPDNANAHFLVFGGSGVDEPFSAVSVAPGKLMLVGRTSSPETPNSSFTRANDAGSGFIMSIALGPPGNINPQYYPSDSPRGQMTDVTVTPDGKVLALSSYLVTGSSSQRMNVDVVEVDPPTMKLTRRAFAQSELYAPEVFPTQIVARDGGFYIVGSTLGVVAGVQTELNSFHTGAVTGASIDGFVVRGDLFDDGGAALRWVRYVGGRQWEFLFRGVTSSDDDVLVTGSSWSTPAEFGITAGNPPYPPSETTDAGHMIFAELTSQGDIRWAQFIGGPNGQDQAWATVLREDDGGFRTATTGAWLWAENDAGSYPNPFGPWYTDRNRQLGLFRFVVDSREPDVFIRGETDAGAPATFVFGSTFDGGVRSFSATITSPDGGTVSQFVDVEDAGSEGPHALRWPQLVPGTYVATVTAVSRDGWSSSGTASTEAVEVLEQDAGPRTTIIRSPAGCTCATTDGATIVALFGAIALVRARRRRVQGERRVATRARPPERG